MYKEDVDIQQDVIEELDWEPSIVRALDRMALEDSRGIVVAVNGTEVTLSGPVRSIAERDEAERAAWAAPGVTMVHDHIKIKPYAYA